jgi:putative ABC transport system substrate-binding protein
MNSSKVLALFLLLSSLGVSSPAQAQPAQKIHLIGSIIVGPPQPPATYENQPFQVAMRARGWIEGTNFVIDRRFAPNEQEARPHAADLVKKGAAVIVVLSGVLANVVRQETTTIPIVTFSAGDLLSMGLVASLARPGGNVTGVQVLQTDLAGKRLSILREMVPTLRKAAVLGAASGGTAGKPFIEAFERDLSSAAARLGIDAQVLFMDSAGPRPVFAVLAAQRIQGLLPMGGSATWAHRKEIFELAAKNRIPTLCDTRAFLAFGCLASYGFSGDEVGRQVAAIVDRILRGANVAEIAVEQPTKIEFVINMKTAKALGITIPQSVLARADEVIE